MLFRSGLEASAEFRFCAANALGDCAHAPVFARKKRDDAISFTQFLSAHNNRLISVKRHALKVVNSPSEARD